MGLEGLGGGQEIDTQMLGSRDWLGTVRQSSAFCLGGIVGAPGMMLLGHQVGFVLRPLGFEIAERRWSYVVCGGWVV
jgi:hypothetical protein